MLQKVVQKNQLLKFYLSSSITLSLLSIFYFLLYFLGISPNGTDWEFYSTLRMIDFSETSLYFQREFISWWLIGQVNIISNGSNYAVPIAIHSSLILSTLLLTANHKGNYGNLIILLIPLFFSNFYILMSVNGLRQGIGLIFFLLFLFYAQHRNFSLAIVFLGLSIFSHNSFILFAPIIFFFTSIPSYLIKGGIIAIFLALFFFQELALTIADRAVGKISPNNFSMLFIGIMLFFFVVTLQINKYLHKVKSTYIYLLFYLLVIPLPFYSDNSLFERICYTSIPIMYIYVMREISKIKVDILTIGIFTVSTTAVSIYFFTNSSIQSNFSF